jgi:molybdenum cofactor synthesis domain-containing protein
MRVKIVIVSDTVSAGTREDLSGPALRERCQKSGWTVGPTSVVADDEHWLARLLTDFADSGEFDLILTSGGTGIGPRDVTPEGTIEILEKQLPGIGEKMRAEGIKHNPRAILSRAVAGVRGETLIVNLPGSPRGAIESLDAIADILAHAVEVLHGARHD